MQLRSLAYPVYAYIEAKNAAVIRLLSARMPEWSKGVALRSTVLRTRGFEPRFSLLFFLLLMLKHASNRGMCYRMRSRCQSMCSPITPAVAATSANLSDCCKCLVPDVFHMSWVCSGQEPD